MSPSRFLSILATLRWTIAAAATGCGYSRQYGHDWAKGARPVPAAVAAWLETLAAFHEAHPPPGR